MGRRVVTLLENLDDSFDFLGASLVCHQEGVRGVHDDQVAHAHRGDDFRAVAFYLNMCARGIYVHDVGHEAVAAGVCRVRLGDGRP